MPYTAIHSVPRRRRLREAEEPVKKLERLERERRQLARDLERQRQWRASMLAASLRKSSRLAVFTSFHHVFECFRMVFDGF